MAYSLVVNTGKSGSVDSTTTDAIDTTGANLIVIGIGWYTGTTANTVLSDSKSNTWTALTAVSATSNSKIRLFYCFNPTVGSGHTFTSAGTATYAAVLVQAFSGSVASPFDQENGAAGDGNVTAITGSVTPSENNELLVTAVGCLEDGSSYTANSGFTITDQVPKGGTTVAGAMAYKIQTTLAAANVTWNWTGTSNSSSAIATFKAATGGGGGGTIPVFMNSYRQMRTG